MTYEDLNYSSVLYNAIMFLFNRIPTVVLIFDSLIKMRINIIAWCWQNFGIDCSAFFLIYFDGNLLLGFRGF